MSFSHQPTANDADRRAEHEEYRPIASGNLPLHFPSDVELTRIANEMFASCNALGESPFERDTVEDLSLGLRGAIAESSNETFPRTGEFPDPLKKAERHWNESVSVSLSPLSPFSAPSPLDARFGTTQARTHSPYLQSTDDRGFLPDLIAAKSDDRPLAGFDPQNVRKDFPILNEFVHGKPLVWLDNAATTQKPRSVIDRLARYYLHENSNVHRAAHELARRSTDAYEAARQAIADFIHATSKNEVVFVRGTTEGINLIAKTFGEQVVREGDEIIITHLEHHANIVPWQQLCAAKKARLLVAPVDDSGQIMLREYQNLFSNRTRIVSLSQVSNAIGTVTPVRDMVEIAHRHHVPVIVDGAQAVSHMAIDVQALDCDFFVFSGHKVFGPTGIGVVYAKEALLSGMPPWQSGGNMIQDVTFERTIYHPAPMRFEAGTGNIADAIGLHAAIEYVLGLGLNNIGNYEHELLNYGSDRLSRIPGLRILGRAKEKAGVLSFVVPGVETELIGKALSTEGIAVRAGHHFAQPILRRLGVESTVRASLAFYNTTAEIDHLVDVVKHLSNSTG